MWHNRNHQPQLELFGLQVLAHLGLLCCENVISYLPQPVIGRIRSNLHCIELVDCGSMLHNLAKSYISPSVMSTKK